MKNTHYLVIMGAYVKSLYVILQLMGRSSVKMDSAYQVQILVRRLQHQTPSVHATITRSAHQTRHAKIKPVPTSVQSHHSLLLMTVSAMERPATLCMCVIMQSV